MTAIVVWDFVDCVHKCLEVKCSQPGHDKAVVLPTVLYASETWTVYQSQATRQPFPLKLHEKTVRHQVARYDSRDRGPDEGGDSKACIQS